MESDNVYKDMLCIKRKVVFMCKEGGFDIIYFKLSILKFSKSFYNILHVFHMVLTCPSAITENMAISEEIRDYFSGLIKPLATNQSLEEMFLKLKEEVMSKFEEKLEKQMNQIDKLEEKLEKKANRIDKLEGQIAL